MREPFAWWWAGAALALALLAVLSSSNYAVAVPAAVAAVALAGLAVGEIVLRLSVRPRAEAPADRPTPADIQEWFRSGPMGREEIVRILDMIERRTLRPGLPARTPGEVRRFLGLRPEEFRRYVDERLTQLEATA